MSGAAGVVHAGAREGAPVERRSRDPIAVLSRRLNSLCVNAVDELQVAAGIEAIGMNDRTAREKYGRASVFDLAQDMYRMVPARPDTRAPRPSRELVGNDLLRGIAYLIPTLLYIGLAQVSDLRDSALALVVALVFVWAVAQGVVYLQQRLLGRDADAAARRVVRAVSIVATLVVLWIATLYTLVAGHGVDVVLGVLGQTVYFLGASVLFSARKEYRLVVLLAPGALFSLLSATVLDGFVPGPIIVLVLVGTVAAVAWTAWRESSTGASDHKVRFAQGEIGAGVLHVVHGFLWACFVAAGAFVGVSGFENPIVSLAAVPLVLSLGFAEWQVRTLGSRTRKLLGRHASPDDYGSAAMASMWISLGVYATALSGLAFVASAALDAADRLDGSTQILVFAYVFLGVALFVGLALSGRGDVSYVIAGSVSGFLALAVADRIWHPEAGIGPMPYLVASIVFATTLLAMARVRVRKPVVP